MTEPLTGKTTADFEAEFFAFSSEVFRPVFWMVLFIGLTHFIVTVNLKNGIKQASKFLMPLLFVIMLILCIRSHEYGIERYKRCKRNIERLEKSENTKISEMME